MPSARPGSPRTAHATRPSAHGTRLGGHRWGTARPVESSHRRDRAEGTALPELRKLTPAGRTSLGPEHRGERGGVKQWKRKSANLRRLALAIICNVAPTGFEPALPP
ncbi:hypothetical protein FMEAI12_3160001 [Parafrankia sp. Ea1.12]|nr:hypothetical protein FMEAI12_3160001 [Parafrankia sp. Ea1.12]